MVDYFNHGPGTPQYLPADYQTTKNIMELVESLWRVGSVLTVSQFERSPGVAERNGNFKVVTESGTYMLKGPNWQQAGQEAARRAQNLCEKFGVPALRIITPSRNISIRFELATFAEGSWYSGTGDQFWEAARALAGLHGAFRDPELERLVLESNRYRVLARTDNIRSVIECVETFAKHDEFDTALMDARRSIRKIIDLDDELATALPAGALQVIHSDMHPHNLLYLDGKIAAVVDFEPLMIANPLRDVAFAAHRLGRVMCKDDTFERDLQKYSQAFLEAYKHNAQISIADGASTSMLGALIIDNQLHIIESILSDRYGANKHKFTLAEFRKHLKLLEEGKLLL